MLRLALACAGFALLGCAPPPKPPAVPATPVHGTVVHGALHSDALGVDKHYVVYLPAGYAAHPTAHYPVMFYLHGITSPETEWIELGKLDAAADALGLAAIVVMPDGDDGFYIDSPIATDYDACLRAGAGLYDPGAPRAETCVRHFAYETYVVRELVPAIDRAYRTIADRRGRGIAGLSMGGYGAFVLALRHPDVFAAAASHSGLLALPFDAATPPETWGGTWKFSPWLRGLFGTDAAFWAEHDPATLVAKLAPNTLALYLDCGSEDSLGLAPMAQRVHAILAARGIDHAFFLGPGDHDYGFWATRVSASLAFLRDHLARRP